MKEPDRVIVVLPIHSPIPTKLELIAFDQCFKILSQHDIVIIHPEGLNLEAYEHRVDGLKAIPIGKEWFASHASYNRLKRDLFFYDLFGEYRYLLTYELDCFVFRDELKYWCSKNYDYIGAPWFDNYTGEQHRIVGVGNSGFSLRDVQTCRKVLKSNRLTKSMTAIFKQHLKESKSWLAKLNLYNLQRTRKKYFLVHLYETFSGHEDAFWCLEVPKYFKDFKIAPVDDARRFSIEEQPEYLVGLNKGQLPFGCHAWYRFDYWKPMIRKFGYDL